MRGYKTLCSGPPGLRSLEEQGPDTHTHAPTTDLAGFTNNGLEYTICMGQISYI